MYQVFSIFILAFSFNALATNLYDFKVNSAEGEKINFSDFKGKVVVISNIATKCGYTGQLDELEKIYRQFDKKGFVVVGVPSNDFWGQTPENNKDVAKFCRLKYGTTFPITQKVRIKGGNQHKLIKFLTTDGKKIAWNFEKFIFSRSGKLVKRFSSRTSPTSSEFVKILEKLTK